MRGFAGRWWRAGCLVLAAACADAHGREGAPVPDPAFALALCEHVQRCDPDGLAPYRGSSMEGCVELLSCAFPGPVPDGCVEAVLAAECTPFALARARYSPACRGVTRLRARGESCAGEQPCGEGLGCVPLEGQPLACATCQVVTIAAAGEACTGRARCDEGLVCGASGVCRVPGELGDPCDMGAECLSLDCREGACHEARPGDACGSYHDCPEGYLCRDSRCEEAPDEGEACEPGDGVNVGVFLASRGCKGAMGCVDGRCVHTPCGESAGLGEPCGLATRCPERAVCDPVTSRCRMWPTIGETCDVEDYQRLGAACFEGYCDEGSGRCQRSHALGAPCDNSQQCEWACDPQTKRCVPSPLSGFDPAAACTPDG